MNKKVKFPSFAGYKPLPLVPTANPAYFNPETGKLTPLSKIKLEAGEVHETHDVLDNLTLAIEAGVVSEKKWLKQIFGTPKAFNDFLEEFECYDQFYRIGDRWHVALSVLGKSVLIEESFVTCAEIADELLKQAQESGQL
jgi:hypothetical protein